KGRHDENHDLLLHFQSPLGRCFLSRSRSFQSWPYYPRYSSGYYLGFTNSKVPRERLAALGRTHCPLSRPEPRYGPGMAAERLRDQGLRIGEFEAGPRNSITDVEGVTVGHVTVRRDEPDPPGGRGVAPTGVTAIVPGSLDGLARTANPAGKARKDVEEGAVGAGTGMICFGWKGGIGTASRVVGGAAVGVLALTNFGAPKQLRIDGVPVGRLLEQPPPGRETPAGSCIVVIATDAPLGGHSLTR